MYEEDEEVITEEVDKPFGFCEHCQGPIYYGEPISYRVEAGGKDYISHKFSTWCNHFIAQRQKFLKDCGIRED